MKDVRDKRDPEKLGEFLLGWAEKASIKVREAQDSFWAPIPDYVSNPGPHEKYGDPRLIPSTLPN